MSATFIITQIANRFFVYFYTQHDALTIGKLEMGTESAYKPIYYGNLRNHTPALLLRWLQVYFT